MDYVDAFILIVGMIGWGTSIMILRQSFYWKNKHDKAVSVWSTECSRKDKLIEKLENKLKTYKDMERVIKIEQVHVQPKEFECKFLMHERFLDDSDLCKRVMVSEAARYLAEEFEKDPYLYTISTEQNYINFTDFIKIRFRMLPYAEPASFNDIFKEEN